MERTFGEIVRENRLARGLTQKQLGILSGYKETTAMRAIQFIEKDQREPDIGKLRPMAEALGITLEELIP